MASSELYSSAVCFLLCVVTPSPKSRMGCLHVWLWTGSVQAPSPNSVHLNCLQEHCLQIEHYFLRGMRYSTWLCFGVWCAPMPLLVINMRGSWKTTIKNRGSIDKSQPEQQTTLKCLKPQAQKHNDLRNFLDLWSSYCINGYNKDQTKQRDDKEKTKERRNKQEKGHLD